MENNRVDEGTREHGALRPLGFIGENWQYSQTLLWEKQPRKKKKRKTGIRDGNKDWIVLKIPSQSEGTISDNLHNK